MLQRRFSGQLFVFLGRRRDKVKLLLWDRNGFWLMTKLLALPTLDIDELPGDVAALKDLIVD